MKSIVTKQNKKNPSDTIQIKNIYNANGKYRMQIQNYTIQIEHYRMQMENIECKWKLYNTNRELCNTNEKYGIQIENYTIQMKN
jgi:hypothetical protein